MVSTPAFYRKRPSSDIILKKLHNNIIFTCIKLQKVQRSLCPSIQKGGEMVQRRSSSIGRPEYGIFDRFAAICFNRHVGLTGK